MTSPTAGRSNLIFERQIASAHKTEHALDFDSGAIVAVTLQGADKGDTTTITETLVQTAENLDDVKDDPAGSE